MHHQLDQQRPRPHAHSSTNPPSVAPRREPQGMGLRRYHSSNVESNQTGRPLSPKPYESEYDKLNRYLRHSLTAKTKAHRRDHSDPKLTREEIPETRPRSKTHFLGQPVVIEDNEDIYLGADEIASIPKGHKPKLQSSRSASPVPTAPFNHSSEINDAVQYASVNKEFKMETAIYGVAQGKGTNLVMELKDLQTSANKLYKRILSSDSNAPEIADLRTFLRSGDKAPIREILQHAYQVLCPPDPSNVPAEDQYSGIYLVDFQDCKEKMVLREKLLQLFTLPGPPSVMYQKVTAKLDSLINAFADIIVKMRVTRNETLTSPFHAQSLLQNAGQEGEQLIRMLQTNELWIKWGTESGLPPLPHIYALKQSPSYEMRKAIVLSMIADKRDVIDAMLAGKTRLESLIPPIYSKLEGDGDRWQVSEYDPVSRKMETHEVGFPNWVDENIKLASHLKSSNRTSFKRGDHIYALYSVYLIVIKDITMADIPSQKENRMPCSHQIFIGSSSTGVLYKFLNVENNHCENIRSILDEAPSMSSFRCHEGIELVEACLALSWVRHQPRAVFVINSFQEGDMTNLSLNKKKPFNDKMTNLEQHYIHSKKLGPTNDMRHGMNRLGDKLSP